MPLYNINEVERVNHYSFEAFDDEMLHNRKIITKFMQHFNEYITNNRVIPVFFVSTESLLAINNLSHFILVNSKYNDNNKKGNLMGHSVYLSLQLSKGEYYIGIKEIEIEQYKRRCKLNKIINKICGHIMEEKQK